MDLIDIYVLNKNKLETESRKEQEKCAIFRSLEKLEDDINKFEKLDNLVLIT